MVQISGKPHSIKLGIRTLGVLALSITFLTGCFDSSKQQELNVKETQSQVKKVKVEKVSKQKIAEPLELTAELNIFAQFALLSKTGGIVKEVIKKMGESVQEGEVILRVDSDEVQSVNKKADLAVQDAREALDKAKEMSAKEFTNSKAEMDYSILKLAEKLEEATRSNNKIKNDYADGLATREQLEQGEKDWKNASDDLEQLKHKRGMVNESDSLSGFEKALRDAETNQEEARESLTSQNITAPSNGILTGPQMFQAGMVVQPNDAIGFIQKLDPILIKASLPGDEAKLIRGKTELSYYLTGTKNILKAPISYLADLMDSETQSYELILQVPNPKMDLKPGTKVQLQLTRAEELIAIAVPTYSIVQDGDQSFVFVLINDTVEKRKVQLGRLNEPYQEVLSGVKEGELVITSGQQALVDKEKVQKS